jgi:prepilin-type N-terminal cleavage/methylation domain-containing protein
MRRKANNAGFSLLEVSMVIVLMGLIFMIVFSFAQVTTRAAMTGTTKSAALDEMQKAITFMTQELQGSSTHNPANYTISADARTLTFIRVQGYTIVNGEAVLSFSPRITYTLDGTQLVRLQDLSNPPDGRYALPGERKVLANGVTSLQFAVGTDGSFSVTIQLRLGDPTRHLDTTVTKTLNVRPQNDF